MDEGFCVSALEKALRLHNKPEIFNTDQGSQYTGAAFTGVLKDHGIRISQDGKGRAMDNIMVERLWRTLKYEDIYIRDYETVEELIKGLKDYFWFYNTDLTKALVAEHLLRSILAYQNSKRLHRLWEH